MGRKKKNQVDEINDNKKFVNFEEKKKQVEGIIEEDNIIEEDPIEVFSPKGVSFKIYDKTYTIYPLEIKKLGIAHRLEKRIVDMLADKDNIEENIEKNIEEVAECLSRILDSPQDKNFFIEKLNVPMLEFICKKIGEASGTKKKLEEHLTIPKSG